jgi:hypothetical protein
MATDDTLREEIEELHHRIAELTEQLRLVTEQRDAARREIARLRDAAAGTAPRDADADASAPLVEVCGFCDGEGVYWVHDFEMQCKRCNGSGLLSKGSAEVTPDRH